MKTIVLLTSGSTAGKIINHASCSRLSNSGAKARKSSNRASLDWFLDVWSQSQKDIKSSFLGLVLSTSFLREAPPSGSFIGRILEPSHGLMQGEFRQYVKTTRQREATPGATKANHIGRPPQVRCSQAEPENRSQPSRKTLTWPGVRKRTEAH